MPGRRERAHGSLERRGRDEAHGPCF
jgi:hypothetical protein